MIAYVTWFTEQGRLAADRLQGICTGNISYAQINGKYGGRLADDRLNVRAEGGRQVSEWLPEAFAKGFPVIFIGAAGIAVRMIAPFVKDKMTDSPVIVMDDSGKYVIPILSGHIGTANELAEAIAEQFTAVSGDRPQAVITTSTDVNKAFAADVFARRNGLRVCNRDGIRVVSGRAVSGGTIQIAIDKACVPEYSINGAVPDWPDTEYRSGQVRFTELSRCSSDTHVDVLITNDPDKQRKQSGIADLVLAPKLDVLGIGCRKNKEYEGIKNMIEAACAEGITDADSIYAVASIDLKADEAGIIEAAQELRVPYVVYSAQELRNVPGSYTSSEFVAKTTGVDNVCERAAVAAADGGRLAAGKRAADGVTLAIAKRRSMNLVI